MTLGRVRTSWGRRTEESNSMVRGLNTLEGGSDRGLTDKFELFSYQQINYYLAELWCYD